MISSFYDKISRLLEMIKFSHTIFALPFALTGMVLAAEGLPDFEVFAWILVAMVGARTAAMAFNRIADRHIDARNPRTAERHIPAGKVGLKDAWLMTAAGAALTIGAAWALNPLCLYLSPVALGAVFAYPYMKRFTSLCHYFLGICLSAAPLGAWMAVTGELDARILVLAVAVVLWVAGFDILYALQDLEFDSSEDLHSIPKSIGVKWSLRLAKGLHAAMFGLLFLLSPLFGLGTVYLLGLFVVATLLVREHSLVSEDDLSKLDAAFFTMNGVISVVVFLSVSIAVWVK